MKFPLGYGMIYDIVIDKGGSNMAELKGASGNMARESHTTAAAAAAATELSIAVSGNLSRTLSELHHNDGSLI